MDGRPTLDPLDLTAGLRSEDVIGWWLAPVGDRLRSSIAVSSWLACGAAFAIVASGAVARAEAVSKPRTVVFAPHSTTAKDDARITREVREAIEKLEVAELLAEPPLDLEAMQLTLDCVGESAKCLREVAKRSHAQLVIALSIERAHGSVVLRALYYDADGEDEPRHVEQRLAGDAAATDLSAAIPDLVRDLFGAEPASETAAPSAEPVKDDQPKTAPEPAPGKRLPIAPIVLGAGGVLVVAAGLTVGALMQSTENQYGDRTIQTPMQAKIANDDRKRGEQQALVANVLIGVGAAALLAGGIWFAVSMAADSEPKPVQTAIVPVVDSHSVGLALVGTWGNRL
jgi:hypothetical protein